MNKKKIKRLAKELETTGSCAFMDKGMLFVIQYTDSCCGGFMVDRYDPYDLDDPEDGGMCTGSAKNAVEFMLVEDR